MSIDNHKLVWDSTRHGMSSKTVPVRAAFVENGAIILVSSEAGKSDSLPPGFQRYLTNDELSSEGLSYLCESE